MQNQDDNSATQFESSVQDSRASSYLLSSRASRRNLAHSQCSAEESIEDFKAEIESKFIETVANKFYVFPLSSDAQLYEPSELVQYSDLQQTDVYNLRTQSQGIKTKTANSQNPFLKKEQILTTRPLSKHNRVLSDTRAPKLDAQVNLISMLKQQIDCLEELSDRIKISIGQKPKNIKQQMSTRKRLQTEPYDKQAGFILKKK